MLAAIAVTAVIAGCSREEHPAPMVTVPLVTQTDVVRAYDLLRAAGLRVSVRNRFAADSLCVPWAQHQSPPPGTASAVGSVVTISTGTCGLGSPAVPKPMPTAKVLNFDGKTASAVVAWAERSRMFWAVRDLTPLSASDAPHLFDNYRVVRQRPSPGATLRPGLTVPAEPPRFYPSPMTVWVTAR